MKTPRLARFYTLLHSAVVALTRDHNAALESLRLVNRELLVTAFAEVPPDVARKCDVARCHVLDAIRHLDPLPAGAIPTVEELPPADHRALVERQAGKFDPLTDLAGQN